MNTYEITFTDGSVETVDADGIESANGYSSIVFYTYPYILQDNDNSFGKLVKEYGPAYSLINIRKYVKVK